MSKIQESPKGKNERDVSDTSKAKKKKEKILAF